MSDPAKSPADASIGELIGQVSNQTSRLVRDEMKLAQAELRETVKHAVKGIGLFSVAGVLALYGVGALLAGIIALLALAIPTWASALIVAAVLFAAAGISALTGKKEVQQASPVPEETISSVQADIAEIKDPHS